jgi:hypothetical protein
MAYRKTWRRAKLKKLMRCCQDFMLKYEKTNGEEYEPDCLKGYASLDCFLWEEGYSKWILIGIMNFKRFGNALVITVCWIYLFTLVIMLKTSFSVFHVNFMKT